MKKYFTFLSILFLLVRLAYAQGTKIGNRSDAQTFKPIANEILSAQAAHTEFSIFTLFQKDNDETANNQLRNSVDSFVVLQIQKDELKRILSARPQYLKLSMPNYNGQQLVISLKQHTITTKDFSVKTSGGELISVDEISGLHYWGIIDNQPNITVAISLFDDDVMAIVYSETGNVVIGKLNHDNKYIVYNDRSLKGKNNFLCGNNVDEPLKKNSTNQNSQQAGSGSANCVELYWEINYDIYLDKGSLTNTTNYAYGIFNEMQLLYANDNINVLLSQIYVWTTPSPYTGTTTADILSEFQNNLGTFNGDLGMLLGYGGNGGLAAGFFGLCNSIWDNRMCYSGVDSYFNSIPTYSWTVEVVTHEQGHLMGSRHTHACVWNGNNTAIDGCGPTYSSNYQEGSCSIAAVPSFGTIMSYCHLVTAINFNLGFGPQPANVITTAISNASCLSSCSPCIVPANNDCNGAILINDNPTCSYTTGTIDCATDDGFPTIPSCNGTSGTQNGVFYKFQAQSNSVTITVNPTNSCGTCLDAVVVVYTGANCNNLNEIPGGCVDDNSYGVSETLNVSVIPGQYYWIRIYDFGDFQPPLGNGGFQVCVSHSCSSPTNISFSGTQSACSGSTTSISVSASNCSGCSYQWSNGGNGSSQSLSPGNYTVTATNNCGSSASNSISISSLLQPNTPSLNAPTTVCQGQSASISVTNSASCANCNYSWSNGGSGTSTSVSSGGIYTVTATNSCGTATASTSNIAAGQLPTQPTISGSLTFCTGSNTTLTVSNPCAGCTYNWSNGQNNTQSIQVSTANTYTVTATNTCGSASNSVTVTQTAAQPIPTINGNLSFCMGSSTSLSIGNACTGCTYLWSNNSTQQSINVNSAASYSVTVTGTCGTASSSVNVTQSSLTANAGNDVNIQSGGSTTLNGSGGISCAWSPSIGLNSSTTCNPTASPTTTTTYTLTVTDANGCTATDAVEVSVGATLHADFYASQTSGNCPLTIDFYSSSTGFPSNYIWEFLGNGVSPASSSSSTPTVTYSQCGQFAVKLTIISDGYIDDEIKPSYINVVCPCISSVDNFQKTPTIEIIPNPTNGYLEVVIWDLNKVNCEVYNSIGQLVKQCDFNHGSNQVDLRLAAKGVYFFRFSSSEFQIAKRVILE